MLVGLTGGIASGKSSAADFFEKLGCYIIDADDLSRQVLIKGSEGYNQVIASFGSNILNNDEVIDRKKLRSIAMDRDALLNLESIIHPLVHREVKREYGLIKGRDSKAIVIYQAPLLIEAGNLDIYEYIVLIWCSYDVQIKRLKNRGYPPYEQAIELAKRQLTYEDKLKYADFIIDNNSDIRNLEKEVNRVYNLLSIALYTKNKL